MRVERKRTERRSGESGGTGTRTSWRWQNPKSTVNYDPRANEQVKRKHTNPLSTFEAVDPYPSSKQGKKNDAPWSGEHLHSGDIGRCQTFIKGAWSCRNWDEEDVPVSALLTVVATASVVGPDQLGGLTRFMAKFAKLCASTELDIIWRQLTAQVTTNILRQCNL